VCSALPLNHILPTDASSSVSIVLILTKSNLKALNNSQYTFGVIVSSVALIIVSGISISAKNIGIGYRQYYKMYIGNQNLTFLWENWPKIVKLCTER